MDDDDDDDPYVQDWGKSIKYIHLIKVSYTCISTSTKTVYQIQIHGVNGVLQISACIEKQTSN